ncbi:MAG TPA: hypothetical protein V6D20_13260 [Candidatus Obscuribacterales bacterium]
MIRINPTLGLTLILLSMMIGAGVVSGSWGYALGREALRGVTQPETRPGQVGTSDGESAPQSGLAILDEEELINNAKNRMAGNTPTAAVTSPVSEPLASEPPNESSSEPVIRAEERSDDNQLTAEPPLDESVDGQAVTPVNDLSEPFPAENSWVDEPEVVEEPSFSNEGEGLEPPGEGF